MSVSDVILIRLLKNKMYAIVPSVIHGRRNAYTCMVKILTANFDISKMHILITKINKSI